MNYFCSFFVLLGFLNITQSVPNELPLTARIVNGQTVRHGDRPYQALLLLELNGGRIVCGGSLISSSWVISAAHCTIAAIQAEIHLGAYSFDNFNEIGRQIYISTVFITHEAYNALTATNDVGLVKLPGLIQFTEYVKPISLPKKTQTNYENMVATTSGWGLQSSSATTVAQQLQFVELKIISNVECASIYSYLIIRSSTICAKGDRRESVCSGDSGGPLVVNDPLSNQTILIGVTSFGHPSGCDFGIPGGFARITSFIEWISRNTGITLV